MEYVGWPSVAAISRRARKTGMLVPYAVAMEVAAQACEGLHAAHELCDETGTLLEVVHGGITPADLAAAPDGPDPCSTSHGPRRGRRRTRKTPAGTNEAPERSPAG